MKNKLYYGPIIINIVGIIVSIFFYYNLILGPAEDFGLSMLAFFVLYIVLLFIVNLVFLFYVKELKDKLKLDILNSLPIFTISFFTFFLGSKLPSLKGLASLILYILLFYVIFAALVFGSNLLLELIYRKVRKS